MQVKKAQNNLKKKLRIIPKPILSMFHIFQVKQLIKKTKKNQKAMKLMELNLQKP